MVVYSEDGHSCSDFHLWFVEDFCSSEIIAMDPGVDRYHPLTLSTIVLILTTHIKEQVGGWPGWPELSNSSPVWGTLQIKTKQKKLKNHDDGCSVRARPSRMLEEVQWKQNGWDRRGRRA